MKKQVPAQKDRGLFQEITDKTMNRNLKTVWMVDLKKAGDRAECLWSKNQRKGAY
jgi:hypothetical protein